VYGKLPAEEEILNTLSQVSDVLFKQESKLIIFFLFDYFVNNYFYICEQINMIKYNQY